MSLFDNSKEENVLKAMKAGDILHYDYRPIDQRDDGSAKLGDTFRVVQWNIERGIKLEAILADLKALHADFIVLQELDINCRRSNYVNVPKEIAKALKAELYFACEFQELDACMRTPENAVGPLSQPTLDPKELPNSRSRNGKNPKSLNNRHFHGNAIISRHVTLRDPTVIPLTSAVVWDEVGHLYKEPRRGFRSALRVCIDAADRKSADMPPLFIYCCHFEVFCGALARVRQLADCMADMQRLMHTRTVVNGTSWRQPAFILAGDLNTMAHGIVRCSPSFGTDRLRWLSVGEDEACWLQRKVLGRNMEFLEPGCCPLSYRFPTYIASRLHKLLCNNSLVWQYIYGFTKVEQNRMANVKLCLYDPSDKVNSITLNHPAYYGFVRGKLDWILLSNLQPRPFLAARDKPEPIDLAALEMNGSITTTSYAANYLRSICNDSKADEAAAKHVPADGYLLFNENYTASDHRGLVMTVQQNTKRPEDVYPSNGAPYTGNWAALAFFALSRVLPVAVVTLGVYHQYKRTR
ncbi:hypothetical protein JKF63_01068 [Porcisia hertigi]|uniref:Endonuclease/exonuclease/phosphatase domain-containing protein n=1 Tax=Porcisia hertigi TaxID=2761500 RepID=A0A836IC89_9TRYP|nr:hypothetical protein JKF63_01068 [Porcisia hertigi]